MMIAMCRGTGPVTGTVWVELSNSAIGVKPDRRFHREPDRHGSIERASVSSLVACSRPSGAQRALRWNREPVVGVKDLKGFSSPSQPCPDFPPRRVLMGTRLYEADSRVGSVGAPE